MKHYELLVCLHCTENAGGDPLVMPFGDLAEMRAWWAEHKAGTGHTWAWRNDDGIQPRPDEAGRLALAYMAENAEYAPPRESSPIPRSW